MGDFSHPYIWNKGRLKPPLPRSVQIGYAPPGIAHIMQPPKFLDGPRMDSEHFGVYGGKTG